jgi:transposase
MDDSNFADFKTMRRPRVDVLGVERRRRWGREEKLRIVRESLAAGAVVSDVARRNEVAASLIYVWRRQALAGLMDGFHPVRIIAEPQGLIASETTSGDTHVVPEARGPRVGEAHVREREQWTEPAPMTTPARSGIEVTLPGGAVVRVDGAVDAKALRAVLAALVER